MSVSELVSELRFRLRALLSRGAVERELDAELQFHLEQETAKYVRQGMSYDAARRQAHLAFGGMNRIKDDTRDARGTAFIDEFLQDVRYAVRGLRARPGFTAGVIVTLGLGIGVNAAMFGVLDRLFLRSPDYLIDPTRVHRVYVGWTEPGQTRTRHERALEYLTYRDLSQWSSAFDATAGFNYRRVAIGTGEDVHRGVVATVTASFFDFFKARPTRGRFFTAAEDTPSQHAAVAVLEYGYWQSRYAGRSDVIGTSIKIDRASYTVIGVAPKHFDGISDLQTPIAFVPVSAFAPTMDLNYTSNYGWSWLEMLARRKPGVTVAAATADLSNAYQRSWNAQMARNPGTQQPPSVSHPLAIAGHLSLGRGPNAGTEARVVIWMSGVAIMVLLIACANVANLLLVRSLRRRREIALRGALGGTRGRLVQQLLTETLVLATLGGLAGVAAAQWGGGALRRVFLTSPDAGSVVADPRTLAFALVATLVAALVAGVLPAFQSATTNTADALKAGSRESSYAHSQVRSALLVIQTALSVVLLLGAGLFVRSLRAVQAIRLGYDVNPLVVVDINGRDTKISAGDREVLVQRLLMELRATSSVVNATQAVTIPFYSSEGRDLRVPGIDSVRKLGRFALQIASPEYFATTGTRLLRGRGITSDDRRGAPQVTIVSEAMANALWPGRDAIGQCIRVSDGSEPPPCRTVIGVAENIKTRSLIGDPEFHYYLPAAQFPTPPSLLVRVNGDGADHAETIRRRLQPLLPGSAYVVTIPMTRILEPHLRSWQYGATMFVAFGTLALALAAIGLYAIVAFAVTQRTHELGLRIALGAEADDILRLVIGEGLGVTLMGVAIGVGVALTVGSRLSPLLYKVTARDPLAYVVVGAILVLVAIVASAVPAMKAAQVDPNVALRVDG
jgi:putative ABC transport system permease protein